MRAALGIVGGIGALVLTALAAIYGYSTSPDPLTGAGIAFFFAFVALIGMGGPTAVIYFVSHMPGWAKLGALPLALVTMAAMFGNFTNSLGALVTRYDAQTAVRSQVADATQADRAELARLMRQRAAMEFTPATAETVTAARNALSVAQQSRAAECGNGDPRQRGPNCRAREADERAAADALREATLAKAATDLAADLDRQITAIRTRLADAPPVASVNPLGEALERLLSIPATEAATWQQGYLVFVAELAVACLLAACEALRGVASPARRAPEAPGVAALVRPAEPVAAAPVASPAHPEPPPTVVKAKPRGNVVPISHAREPGDVAQFAVARLRPVPGASVVISELYAPYQQWCRDEGFQAVSADEFCALFAALCDLSGFKRKIVSGKTCCLDLSLVA